MSDRSGEAVVEVRAHGRRRRWHRALAAALALGMAVPGTSVVAAGPSVSAATGTLSSCATAAVTSNTRAIPEAVHGAPAIPSVAGTLDAPRSAADAGPVGTAHMVRDIDTTGGSDPRDLTPYLGGVAFSARDDAHGRELYLATSAGTKRLRDIRPGSASSSPRELTVVNGRLFFSADDGTHGRELWKTDGTSAGTKRVRDIRPGSGSSSPAHLTALGSKLLFAARDASHGRELWRSDGTKAGTVLVKDIQAHGSSLYSAGFDLPDRWVAFQGRVYFGVQFDNLGLWRTDGTKAGTKRVYPEVYPQALVATSVRLFFIGITTGCAADIVLFTSDGTTNGTRMVANAYGADTLVTFGGRAYYAMGDGGAHRLYRSSGSYTNHGEVKPKVAIDEVTPLEATGHALFLSQGGMLSISDGTGVGTHPLADAEAGMIGAVDVAYLNGLWYFPGGYVYHTSDLWQTDGTSEGTRIAAIVDLDAEHDVRDVVRSGGSIWFTGDDGTHGREVWRYRP